MRTVSDLRWLRIADAPRCQKAVGSDENDNDSQYLSQHVRPETRKADPAGAEEDLEGYRAEYRAVDAALEGAKLDDTFTVQEKTTSVRWMWQHLVEEYARHNGNADLLS